MNSPHEPPAEEAGWLRIVGTGIRTGQLTFEAQQALRHADIVYALVTNVIAVEMLRLHNPNLKSLRDCYSPGKERGESYREMAERVLKSVRAGNKTCLAIYGHPAVFAQPSRLALEIAQREGHDVEILPGISAEDSMFCDLQIDPAVHGCQTYSATVFVRQDRSFDPRSILTLWQVSIIGESRLMAEGRADCLQGLCNRLEAVYGPSHPAILYEAATNPFFGPDMRRIEMSELRTARIRPCCTVVIPPIDCPDLVKAPLSTEESQWVSWSS